MSETDLPEYIERDVLLEITSVNVPDEVLLKCFVRADKPFLSKSAISDMTDLSDEGVRKRLNSLVDRGVLLTAGAGKQTKIYWLNHPESQWPVPSDLNDELAGSNDSMNKTVLKINRLTTFAMFYAGVFGSLFVLDWLSDLRITDGIFSVTMTWDTLPIFALGLYAILFFVALQTSLQVENDDAGWPTIRRIYRQVTS